MLKEFGESHHLRNTEVIVMRNHIEKLDNASLQSLSITEIGKVGSDIQAKINKEMGSIIATYKTFDVGAAGEQLNELAVTANSATKGLSRSLPMLTINKFLGKFDTVEGRMEKLTDGITKTKTKLDTVMSNMTTSRDYLAEYIKSFHPYEAALEGYLAELDSEGGNYDDIRKQAVVNRLKMLTSSRVVAEQSFAETTLLIGQTQEVQYQIDEMLTNVVPIFKMKMVNALSINAHKEALALKEKVTKVSEKLIIDNAKNIEKNTSIMLENRRKAIISPETLLEANEILQGVVKNAVKSCATEREANEGIIKRLNDASQSLRDSGEEMQMLKATDDKIAEVAEDETHE